MKKEILVFLFLIYIASGFSQQNESDLNIYLPKNGQVYGWNRQYLPELFKNTNLYSLIDGQATVFFEYGFSEAIVCDYINPDKDVIHVEIYKMKDAAACYGIYSFNLAENGQVLSIGDEAAYYELYLLFRKGRYFVTITSGNDNANVQHSIKHFGNNISSVINDSENIPTIANIISKPTDPAGKFLYLRGPLSLRKIYPFSHEDQFKFKEGIAADYDSIHIIALKFDDILSCKSTLTTILKLFIKLPAKYKLLSENKSSLSFNDNKDNYIFFKSFENYIFILISHKKMNDDEADKIIFRNIEKRIMVDLLPEFKAGKASVDEITYYYKDELYDAIDGGADIFHEYGFECMLSAKYVIKDVIDNGLPIEIYKMSDPIAAAGIFSMMSTDGFYIFNNNDSLYFAKRRMLFKKNLFFILNSNDTTAFGNMWSNLILKNLYEKIEKEDKFPSNILKLKQSAQNGEKIRIIRGNLALNNIYQFGQKLIKNYEMAMVLQKDSLTSIIFDYISKDSAQVQFENTEKIISGGSKFHSFNKSEDYYTVIDKKDQVLFFTRFRNHILIIISRNTSQIHQEVAALKLRIK